MINTFINVPFRCMLIAQVDHLSLNELRAHFSFDVREALNVVKRLLHRISTKKEISSGNHKSTAALIALIALGGNRRSSIKLIQQMILWEFISLKKGFLESDQ